MIGAQKGAFLLFRKKTKGECMRVQSRIDQHFDEQHNNANVGLRPVGAASPDPINDLHHMSSDEFARLYKDSKGRWQIKKIYKDFVESALKTYNPSSRRRRTTANTLVKYLHQKGFSVSQTHNTIVSRGLPGGARSLFQYALVVDPTIAKQLAPHVPYSHMKKSIEILLRSVFGMKDLEVHKFAKTAQECVERSE